MGVGGFQFAVAFVLLHIAPNAYVVPGRMSGVLEVCNCACKAMDGVCCLAVLVLRPDWPLRVSSCALQHTWVGDCRALFGDGAPCAPGRRLRSSPCGEVLGYRTKTKPMGNGRPHAGRSLRMTFRVAACTLCALARAELSLVRVRRHSSLAIGLLRSVGGLRTSALHVARKPVGRRRGLDIGCGLRHRRWARAHIALVRDYVGDGQRVAESQAGRPMAKVTAPDAWR